MDFVDNSNLDKLESFLKICLVIIIIKNNIL